MFVYTMGAATFVYIFVMAEFDKKKRKKNCKLAENGICGFSKAAGI